MWRRPTKSENPARAKASRAFRLSIRLRGVARKAVSPAMIDFVLSRCAEKIDVPRVAQELIARGLYDDVEICA